MTRSRIDGKLPEDPLPRLSGPSHPRAPRAPWPSALPTRARACEPRSRPEPRSPVTSRSGAGWCASVTGPGRFLPSRYGGSRMRRGGPYAHRSMLAPMGPIRMARGVPKNSRNRLGSLAARNSPTDAVITADISLTVRAYDHASLGSPPPKHLGVESGVGISSHQIRRCSFPATPFRRSRRFRAQARLPPRKPKADPTQDRGERVRVTSWRRDKIEPGWACRAEPGSGVGDVPPIGAALFPRFSGRARPPTFCGCCGGSCCGGEAWMRAAVGLGAKLCTRRCWINVTI